MKRNVTAVIFDMDGVLVDSEYAMRASSIEALKKYGIKAEHEDFYEFTGMGEDMFVGGVARKHGIEYKTCMKDEAYDIYVKRAKEAVYVFPGVKELLQKLKDEGYYIAVASAADFIKVKANLGCIGVGVDLFNAVISGSEVKNKKPDPEIFIKAAQKIGVKESECLVIEDAVSGVKAAKAANMKAIAVKTSFDEDALSKAGADFVIDKISEAFDIIKTL